MHQGEGAIAVVFQAHLDALEGELRGARREDRLREAVDGLMRMQALVAPDADAAARCLDGLVEDTALAEPLRATARELFGRHRERIERIRARELSRAGYVARRAAAGGAR
jgi:hypothetical protein